MMIPASKDICYRIFTIVASAYNANLEKVYLKRAVPERIDVEELIEAKTVMYYEPRKIDEENATHDFFDIRFDDRTLPGGARMSLFSFLNGVDIKDYKILSIQYKLHHFVLKGVIYELYEKAELKFKGEYSITLETCPKCHNENPMKLTLNDLVYGEVGCVKCKTVYDFDRIILNISKDVKIG